MIAPPSAALLHGALVQTFIAALDWAGTVAFAFSGALLAVQKRCDLFGVLFLAFVTAVAGGLARDLLIGAVPPVAITDVHYFLLSLAAGLVTFLWYGKVAILQRPILLFDAVGLALFAVVGASKALDWGINPLMAALLGMITGIGGGMARDVLAGSVPFVLRADLYAVAALAGAGVVSLGHVFGLSPVGPMLLGAGLCVFLRLMALFRGWRAPLARRGGGAPS
jgi:uncharacterized membrane protein YeiH